MFYFAFLGFNITAGVDEETGFVYGGGKSVRTSIHSPLINMTEAFSLTSTQTN